MSIKSRSRLATAAALVLTGAAMACGSSDESGLVAASPTVSPPPAAASTATPTAIPTVTPEPTSAPEVSLIDLGKSLAARNGCTTCHTIDGTPRVGPTWKGLYMKEETLIDGSAVTVDDDNLRLSIVDPDAEVVAGFVAGIMPGDFGARLDDDQIGAIIEYIKSLQ